MKNHWTLITVILTIKLLSAYAADNEIPTECPQVDPINTTIHIAHELDCSKFYSCSNGRKILMMCPLMDGAGNRLHFNPKLQVCDWPHRAGCNVSDITTTIPTELTSVGTDNSTEWVVTTESTEANNNTSLEVTETTTEVITESSTSEQSTVTVSSGSNSTVTQAPTTSTSPTVHETYSTPRLPQSSTTVSTQKPQAPNSTETETQPSTTTQSTVQETEATSETTHGPSESTPTETEDSTVISNSTTITPPTEITTESTVSSTFLTSSTPQVITTNQTEITTTTTTQIISTTNSTIITTDDFDSNETISTLPTPLPKCTSNVSGILYPHESDCSLFYICDHGKLVLLSCAQGLYFDEPRQICVWPYETNCQNPTPLNPSTTVSSTSTTFLTTPTSTNISDLCPTDNSNNGVLYPHECVCSKFYLCTNGQLVLNQCPGGLNFNSKLNLCDWPENVQCQSSSTTPTTTLSTSTLSNLVETIKPIEPNSTKSSNLIDQPTVSKSECPKNGSEPQLPHETNCRLYYECKDGEKWLKECSSGLEFNPALEFCDRPELAGCSNSESNQGTTTVGKPVSETSNPVIESSTPKNETSVPVESSTLSSNKCLRPCPVNDPIDYTVLVEHESCSKFCKCSHGIPYVLNCPADLQFNSLKQTCDYPERANCNRQLA